MGRHIEISTSLQLQSRLQAVAGRPQFRARLPLAVFAFIAVCGVLLVNLADPYTASPSWAGSPNSGGPAQKYDSPFGTTGEALNRDGFTVANEAPAPVPAEPPAAAATASVATQQPAKAATKATAPTVSNSGDPRAIGQELAAQRGWTGSEWTCLLNLWNKESQWRASAYNPAGPAYGIPQAVPGSKMASAGSDWETNPATQIKWGMQYIASGAYRTPCGAWSHSQQYNWY